MKGKTILLPPKPSPDKIIAAAVLMHAGIASEIKTISMLPHERWQIPIKGVIPIGLDVNYKEIKWRSYTEVIVSQYSIERTPEIKRLVQLADKNVRHETELGSLSDLINAFYSAQYKEPKEFNEDTIITEGIQCVFDLIQFSKLKLSRDIWTIEILQKGVQETGPEKVPRLFQYLQRLNAGVKIDCDLVELLTARKQLKSEVEARRLAEKIIKAYKLANEVFQLAIQVCKNEAIIKDTPKGKIVAAVTDNPVFFGGANIWFKQPALTIQQLPTGHIQIFLREDLPEKVSDDLTILLRGEELKLAKKEEEALSKEREAPEIPKWFYVRNPYGSKMILNASIRVGVESIAPTKIPLMKIVEFAELVLRAN